ncbi:MAG TPA: CerR family C-terminal domain-containing protein [Candidatus Binatia bacterium]|jgi:AcrR family transcriptional regulator
MASGSPQTPGRLLAAATDLFARRGFHATSIRDIAERAGANVAAGHYHYGSKRGLYVQVLRAQFALVRELTTRDGALPSKRVLARWPRRELIALLTRRVAGTVEVLLDPPSQAHGALMLREMCDPTDALPIIVDEFIRPQMKETARIVACLAPHASARTVEQVVRSIIAQVLFYRFTMPATLLLIGAPRYSRRFLNEMTAHVIRFSIGGLAHVGRGRRRRDSPRGRR